MSLDKSDVFEPAEISVETETVSVTRVIENKEPPRKRYAAPSAPRVLRCLAPSITD